MANDNTPRPTRCIDIQRGSAGSPDLDPDDIKSVIDPCAERFCTIEEDVLNCTLDALRKIAENRHRDKCDEAFGYFTHCLLLPCDERGLASRAAAFATSKLIPKVLELEKQHTVNFHKGALFYDTALAYLIIGDEARFEYCLAMASEEDYETHAIENKPRTRGIHSLKTGQLSEQTITARVQFAVDLLNGGFSTSPTNYAFVFGETITTQRFDQWRRDLDPFHHAELFRFLYEAQIFLGQSMPNYDRVLDNPYVMSGLVKSLAHAAQWIESRLSMYQASLPSGIISRPTLFSKLRDDPNLQPLVTAADSSGRKFPGNNPSDATTADTELRALLTDILSQTKIQDKEWRILRILYIIRNSTAHKIEEALSFYSDRAFLTELLQVVFVACFVIEKRKTGSVP